MQKNKPETISNNISKNELKSKLVINLESLTPKDDIDISSYEEALDFALSNDTVTNIAMTGPYGAGKSSVIESYKKKNKDKRFMNISLTHFEGSEKTNTNVLEGKIVNQLLHQIDYDKIPQTIFKIKANTKKSKILGYSASIIVFILNCLLTFKFEDWKKYLNHLLINEGSSDVIKKVVGWLSSNVFNIIVLIAFLSTTVILLYFFIKLQLNRQLFKKVTFKGNEVEIFKDREESYFDKFLNDVIYLFTSSEKDIIIFEDLDRFENTTIYERLYEINLLINKRLLANGSKPQIKFIYLIKDDAFESKDRSKLFDLIIPIVPVIDSSNSFEQFLQVFDESGISEEFDKKTLQKLSLYIDDMRLLKNISNEYYIYKNRLSQVTLDNDKLLATIVYKNIFPKDFSNFQLGLGFINKVFSLKNILAEEKVNRIKQTINKLNIELESIEKESLTNLDELDSLFFIRPVDGYYKVKGKKESDFISSEHFISAIKNNNYNVEKVRSVSKTEYYSYDVTKSEESVEINIAEDFEELKESEEYLKRFDAISKRNNFYGRKLKEQKKELQFSINKISSMAISELLETVENTFFYDEHIKTDDLKYLYESPYFELIIFILREGLIDENYTDYLTYFYEHSLSKEDKEFLRGIYDRKPKEWRYQLKNTERVISELTSDELSRFKVLNFDLIIYCMSNKEKYNSELKTIIDYLRRIESNEYLLDIYEYFKEKNEVEAFFEIIEEKWDSVLEDLILLSENKRTAIEEFIYIAIYYFSIENINHDTSNRIIIDFIEQSMDFMGFIEINNISLDCYLEKLSEFKVKFSNIISTLPHANKIIELDLFRLSVNNLKQIFFTFELGMDEDFYQNNLTLVLGNQILKKILYEDKLNTYIRTYIDLSDNFIEETEETILELLNNDKLERENAVLIISRLKETTKIDEITDINDKEYRKILFDSGNIKVNGYNVIEYFIDNNNVISEKLVERINNCHELISFEEEKRDYDDDLMKVLFRNIIIENEFNNYQYSSMLKSLNRYYKKGFGIEVSEEKVGVLIDSDIIKLTSKNVLSISEKYPRICYKFVLNNLEEFIEIFETEEIYDQSLLLKFLKNNHLNLRIKKRLTDISQKELSIIGTEYSSTLKIYIVNNRFDKTDLEELLKGFSMLEKPLQTAVYSKIKEYLEEILENDYQIDRELLLKLLHDRLVEDRQALFIKYIKQIKLEELEYFINQLKLPMDLVNVLKGKRPTFTMNSQNKSILEEYKRRDYINEIHEEEGRYRVYGKRVLEK